MEKQKPFTEFLGYLIKRAGTTPGKLSRLTEKIFGPSQAVPKATIVNWRVGRVGRPHWEYLVKLAVALRVTEAEVNKLLDLTESPSISKLVDQTQDHTLRDYLSDWDNRVIGEWANNQKGFSVEPQPI